MFDRPNDYSFAEREVNLFPRPPWKFGTRQIDDRADA